MLIIVDYDNLPKADQRKGLQHVATRIANALGPAVIIQSKRSRLRLYGGWYEGANFTRIAQDLAVQIQGVFPRPITVTDGASSATTLMTTELATALESEPATNLIHTYRPRGPVGGILSAPFPLTNCGNVANCGLKHVHAVLSAGGCPTSGCQVAVGEVIHRAEQKLVDTMITADLVFAATKGDPVVIVSSDDDMWAGIRTALAIGGRVMHVHPKPIRGTISYYEPRGSAQYSSFQM